MSPEYHDYFLTNDKMYDHDGQCGLHNDVYCLGATTYALLTGSPPPRGVAVDALPFPADTGPRLATLIRLMLCEDPTLRPTAAAITRHPLVMKSLCDALYCSSLHPPTHRIQSVSTTLRGVLGIGSLNQSWRSHHLACATVMRAQLASLGVTIKEAKRIADTPTPEGLAMMKGEQAAAASANAKSQEQAEVLHVVRIRGKGAPPAAPPRAPALWYGARGAPPAARAAVAGAVCAAPAAAAAPGPVVVDLTTDDSDEQHERDDDDDDAAASTEGAAHAASAAGAASAGASASTFRVTRSSMALHAIPEEEALEEEAGSGGEIEELAALMFLSLGDDVASPDGTGAGGRSPGDAPPGLVLPASGCGVRVSAAAPQAHPRWQWANAAAARRLPLARGPAAAGLLMGPPAAGLLMGPPAAGLLMGPPAAGLLMGPPAAAAAAASDTAAPLDAAAGEGGSEGEDGAAAAPRAQAASVVDLTMADSPEATTTTPRLQRGRQAAVISGQPQQIYSTPVAAAAEGGGLEEGMQPASAHGVPPSTRKRRLRSSPPGTADTAPSAAPPPAAAAAADASAAGGPLPIVAKVVRRRPRKSASVAPSPAFVASRRRVVVCSLLRAMYATRYEDLLAAMTSVEEEGAASAEAAVAEAAATEKAQRGSGGGSVGASPAAGARGSVMPPPRSQAALKLKPPTLPPTKPLARPLATALPRVPYQDLDAAFVARIAALEDVLLEAFPEIRCQRDFDRPFEQRNAMTLISRVLEAWNGTITTTKEHQFEIRHSPGAKRQGQRMYSLDFTSARLA
jgi:hypothetical protein